jgi:hypothetical protein
LVEEAFFAFFAAGLLLTLFLPWAVRERVVALRVLVGLRECL